MDSVKVQQEIKMRCNDTLTYQESVQFVSFDDNMLSAEGAKKMRYGVREDGCSVSKMNKDSMFYKNRNIIKFTCM